MRSEDQNPSFPWVELPIVRPRQFVRLRTGHIVSRADIWEQLYDFADEADSNVIDVFINRLRKKSELGGSPRIIHTRRGLGYVLIDPDSK